MWKPNFRISHVRISNVGAIDDFEMDFECQGSTCLFAGNGVGKTTILECLSLLGHLPCLPTINESGAISHSLLRKLSQSSTAKPNIYRDKFHLDRLSTESMNSWADLVRPPARSNYGLVELVIEDNQAGFSCRNFISILVHEKNLIGDKPPRLTNMLSRGDFDNKVSLSNGNPEDGSDIELEKFGLIVYRKSEQEGQTVDDLIHKIALGRTFRIRARGGDFENVEYSSSLTKERPELEPRSVAYLNTDLNDFGRGGDLRESPKNLQSDFGNEMFSRLRVERTNDGFLFHLKELSDACNFVLNSEYVDGEKRSVVLPSFVLKIVKHSQGNFDLFIDRKDGGKPNSITFLSAGENEVFFVFLMLINLSRNPALGQSIALLDEPDLHLSVNSRSRFFSKIFDVCGGSPNESWRSLQLVCCSHSPAFYDTIRSAYNDAERSAVVVAREMLTQHNPLDTVAPPTKLSAFCDPLYVMQMQGRTYHQSTPQAVIFWIRSTLHYHYVRTRDAVSWGSDFSAVAFLAAVIPSFVFLLYFGFGKIVNDELKPPSDRQSFFGRFFLQGRDVEQYHDWSNEYLNWSAGIFGTLILIVIISRFVKRRNRKAALRRFKGIVNSL